MKILGITIPDIIMKLCKPAQVYLILSLISLVPLAIDESGTLTVLFSYGTQIPNWFFYYFLYNLLGALFMVVPALYFDRGQRITWKENSSMLLNIAPEIETLSSSPSKLRE